MLFSTFSKYLSRIEKTSSRIEITKILSELFKKCGSNEIDKCAYLITGKVTPQYEPEKFNLAEKTVIKAIAFAFNKKTEQITKLFHEKGDMGEVAISIAGNSQEKTIETASVYQKLYELTQISGVGTIENKIRIISSLLKDLDGTSRKYIIRIILDKLRLGFSDATVLDAFSWMLKGNKSLKTEIEKKYNIHPDLGLIGKILKEKGIAGLDKIQIEPGSPILMARCERAGSPSDILEHGEKFGIEDKFDGFRLQIHITKNQKSKNRFHGNKNQELFENNNKEGEKEVVIYSRNLENVTNMYPDIVEGVLKTFPNVNSLIIEGEAVGFDPKTGKILPFQETVQRKRKYEIEKMSASVPLKLITFEILYLNGKELINENFIKRREILESIIEKSPCFNKTNIVLSDISWCQTEVAIEKIFKRAVSKNMEGIVAKKANGIYQAGARGWNWIKLKRGFQGQKLFDTIDCVVMGYDFGQGKRNAFGIGDFLIGVYNEKSQVFETVAKIGTGLTDEEWKKIKNDIDKIAVKNTPKEYRVKKEMFCNVWAKPNIVVEIMADEITRSPIHTGGEGLALRFPRLVRFRPDKKPENITTTKELKKMYKNQ